MVGINDYQEERECVYKGEHYSVRDNGAVMRHRKEGKAQRPLDEKWTFGRANEKCYFEIAGVPVHRIVATAFHGEPKFADMVVDHIDTNHSNNRPENLRWLTRLQNVLENPITLRKIIHLCGSVESFLQNPNQMKSHFQDCSWMHRMSKEEAEYSYKKWIERVNTPKEEKTYSPQETIIDVDSHLRNIDTSTYVAQVNAQCEENTLEWATDYKISPYEEEQRIEKEKEEQRRLEYEQEEERIRNLPHDEKVKLGRAKPDVQSKNNPLAMQRKWRTPSIFMYCPTQMGNNPLEEYANAIEKGKLFAASEGVYDNYVVDYHLNTSKTFLAIKSHVVSNGSEYTKDSDNYSFGVMGIYIENEKFIHEVSNVIYYEDEWEYAYRYMVEACEE